MSTQPVSHTPGSGGLPPNGPAKEDAGDGGLPAINCRRCGCAKPSCCSAKNVAQCRNNCINCNTVTDHHTVTCLLARTNPQNSPSYAAVAGSAPSNAAMAAPSPSAQSVAAVPMLRVPIDDPLQPGSQIFVDIPFDQIRAAHNAQNRGSTKVLHRVKSSRVAKPERPAAHPSALTSTSQRLVGQYAPILNHIPAIAQLIADRRPNSGARAGQTFSPDESNLIDSEMQRLAGTSVASIMHKDTRNEAKLRLKLAFRHALEAKDGGNVAAVQTQPGQQQPAQHAPTHQSGPHHGPQFVAQNTGPQPGQDIVQNAPPAAPAGPQSGQQIIQNRRAVAQLGEATRQQDAEGVPNTVSAERPHVQITQRVAPITIDNDSEDDAMPDLPVNMHEGGGSDDVSIALEILKDAPGVAQDKDETA